MKRIIRWAVQVCELILSALFLWGSVNVLTGVDPVTTEIGFIKPLVGDVAIFIYGVLFGVLGLALLAGKVLRKKTLHGYSLMGMYLTVVYVVILEFLLEGFSYDIVSDVVIALITAALYLRWKYSITETLRPSRKKVVEDLLNEQE